MKATVSFPIRMPKALLDAIKKACERTGVSQQDLCRLAMQIGLEVIERRDYKLASAIVDADEAARSKMTHMSVVADTPGEYKAGKRPA